MYLGEALGKEDNQELTGSKAVPTSSQGIRQQFRGRFNSGIREKQTKALRYQSRSIKLVRISLFSTCRIVDKEKYITTGTVICSSDSTELL